ncbi:MULTISPECIES: acyl carrier protein [Streptococcus]|jgi:phosphopantetheine attachment domain protein|uniref:Carrier domain-containing protein n=1 Tax=Streptococcus salivarius TaxID=1304 RepID=A0AA45CRQ5_STRSL|nr:MULTISPECIES: acyl carrier protein [Streptococcus]MBK5079916.1 acyl carrier protein [Streptococcus sp. 22.1]MEB3645891.1 acyl carrier protein [Streptococcus salivarius]PZD55806.1 hypothetical protein CKU37_08900 [Streptococcus salivarius]
MVVNEKNIALDVWKQVLNITEIPEEEDTFYSLGGTSLQLVEVLFVLKNRFSIDCTMRELMILENFGEFITLIKEKNKK